MMVYPNPGSLGGHFAMQGFRIPEEAAQRRFLRFADLSIPAVMSFQTEDVWVFLIVIAKSQKRFPWMRELADESGVAILSDPIRIPFPLPRGQLRPTDWALISALRQAGDSAWSPLADSLHMTPRALGRRISLLMERDQLFFYPYIDLRRSSGTVAHVAVFFSPGTDEERARQSIVEEIPELHPLDPIFSTRVLLPDELRKYVGGEFQFMAPLPSMAVTDRVRHQIGRIPGVWNTHVSYPVQNEEVHSLLDRMIATAGRSPETRAPALSSDAS
jgi:DNA-binding Lrp family transcriptional regulator